jgi:MSHA biogenesis protein MshN
LGGVAMSLINQVLKDLDKRGASTNIGESTIRVVHGHSNRNAVWLVVAGAVGMFMLGSSGWMFWQSQHTSQLTTNAVVPAQSEIHANVPVMAAPVMPLVPNIVSISPATIYAIASPQTVVLNGINFKEGARVNLKDEAGNVYADRTIIGMTQEQITLKLNFGTNPSTWWVEVRNPDQATSGQFAMVTKSSKGGTQNKPLVAGLTPANTMKPQNLIENEHSYTPADGAVNKLPTQNSAEQQAENEFRNAYQLMRQGLNSEALSGFEAALKLNVRHEQARQNMVSILLEKKRNAEAELALEEGLSLNVRQFNFAMLLARLQVERNALPAALDTLLRTLPYAETQPNYQSFVAALMQRQNRHKEAISYYQKALQLKPNLGVWLMGLGISLRAEQRKEEARSAFKQALDTNTLNTELQSFVNQQLKEL